MSFKKDVILGAIIGDVVGSRFEVLNINNKEFDFFLKTVILQMIQ